MASMKMTMGKDATISVLSNKVHPSELIRKKWPNPIEGNRIVGKVLRQQMKIINRKPVNALVFKSPSIVDSDGTEMELHSVPRWCKLVSEGPAEYFFTVPQVVEPPADGEEGVQVSGAVKNLLRTHGPVLNADLTPLVGVVDIDDDNQPAPENVPTPGDAPDDIFGEWGHNGVCERKKVGAVNRKARLKNFRSDIAPSIEQIHLPRLHVCTSQAMAFWKRMAYYCLWVV